VKEAISTYKNVISTAAEGPAGLTARSRLAHLLAVEGNTKEAEQLLAEVLKKNSNDSEALLIRAGLALTKHDAAAAVADLRGVLRDQSDNQQALKLLAQAHVLNNELGLAEETLKKAAVLMPKDVEIKLGLAELLIRQGKFDTARSQVAEVLKTDATQPQALEAMFKLQMSRKEWAAAQTTVATLLKAHPKLPQGDYYSGMVLEAQGKRTAAIAAYHKALDKSPDAIEPLTGIVKAHLAQRQTKEALVVLESALKRAPNNFIAQNLRGEVLLLEGNAAEAEKAFTTAIELNPKIPSIYRNLGSARLARNDAAAAHKAYEDGLKQSPDNEMLVYSMAALDEREGKFDRAIGRYEELMKRKPDSAMAKNNLAMMLVSHRSDQESLNKARDLVLTLTSSDEPAYLDTVGWVHYRRGDVEQAIATLESALKKAPSSALIHYHIGMAYYTKGNKANALQHLEEALAAKTGFQGVDEARATLNKLKSS
jgi:tetratricopeptide (TPR) repeat protein